MIAEQGLLSSLVKWVIYFLGTDIRRAETTWMSIKWSHLTKVRPANRSLQRAPGYTWRGMVQTGTSASSTHVVVGIQDSGDVLSQVPVQDRLDVAPHIN